jgi:hypothetical protein
MTLVASKPKPKEVNEPMVTLSEPMESKKLEIPDSLLLVALVAASLLTLLWLIFAR